MMPPTHYNWFDFEMTLLWHDHVRSVRVEATVSSSRRGVSIEGVKVRLLDTDVQVVPTDKQMHAIYEAILSRV